VLDFFQMAVGYSLTGYTREEKFFHIPGSPRSGKGTVTEVLTTLLGEPLIYDICVQVQLFLIIRKLLGSLGTTFRISSLR